MKIDKNKLVELLVEKTSMGKHEVEAQLEQLIERIASATKRGKALEIKGFGTFYFDTDNELKFDPATSLSTEISYKYAGMQPVELKPERDTSIPAAAETEDGTPGEIDSEENIPAEEAQEASGHPDEKSSDDSLSGTDAAIGSLEKSSEDSADQKETKEVVSSGTKQAEPDQKERPADVRPGIKQKQRTIQARKPAGMERRRKSGAIIWVLLGILLIAAALAAYFYYTGQEAETSLLPQETTGPVSSSQQVFENGTADDDIDSPLPDMEHAAGETPASTTSGAVNNDNAQQQAISGTAAAAGLQNQPVYGLTGEVNQQANDGYSIVLHSFDEEDKTEEAALFLTNEGYRTIVGSRTVAGRTMWRVSVGQFQTLQEAQDAAAELPSSFNTQNFIHRIQLNN